VRRTGRDAQRAVYCIFLSDDAESLSVATVVAVGVGCAVAQHPSEARNPCFMPLTMLSARQCLDFNGFP